MIVVRYRLKIEGAPITRIYIDERHDAFAVLDAVLRKMQALETGDEKSVGPDRADGAALERTDADAGRRPGDINGKTIPDPAPEVRPTEERKAGPAPSIRVRGSAEGRADRGTDLFMGVEPAPAPGVRDTSRDAYQELKHSGALSAQQHQVLVAIVMGNQADWTRQELARATGLGINAVCGRVNEMLRAPFEVLEEVGRRSCTVTGESANALRCKHGDALLMVKAA